MKIRPPKRPTRSPKPTGTPNTPFPTEPHIKVFETNQGFRCKVKKRETRFEIFTNVTLSSCDNKCGFSQRCKSYNYNNMTLDCITYNLRVTNLIDKKPFNVCVRIPKATRAPVKPTEQPVRQPTKKPVKPTKRPIKPTRKPVKPTTKPVKPTKKPFKPPSVECNLKATLGFDFKDPDNAPYFGGHADWLEVIKKGTPKEYICSAYYHGINDNPVWCKYSNSVKGGDSAYVENMEDEYYTAEQLKTEQVSEETVKIKSAADYPTVFRVYHYLWDKDYYPNLDTWQDYKMAAKLKIHNLSNPKQSGQLGRTYQHPTTEGQSTHVKINGESIGNPNYEGNFEVTVTCTRFCFCSVDDYKVSKGFVDYRLSDGVDGNHNTKRRHKRLDNDGDAEEAE